MNRNPCSRRVGFCERLLRGFFGSSWRRWKTPQAADLSSLAVFTRAVYVHVNAYVYVHVYVYLHTAYAYKYVYVYHYVAVYA